MPRGTGLVSWRLVYTKQAQKDAKKLPSSDLKPKAQELLSVLAQDPFRRPPPYEKLIGDLAGAYSRRINIQHRLVYEVLEGEKIVKVLRMWSHYELSIITNCVALIAEANRISRVQPDIGAYVNRRIPMFIRTPEEGKVAD